MRSIVKNVIFDIQFWLAVLGGWLICSVFWANRGTQNTETEKTIACECLERRCSECKYEDRQKAVELDNRVYRDYAWTPYKANEDSIDKWRLSSRKNRFGLTNEDPVVGINGMWRLEREKVEMYQKKHLKESVLSGDDSLKESNLELKHMMANLDPFAGLSYIVDARDIDAKSQLGKEISVKIEQKYRKGKPTLIDINVLNTKETIHIITPLSRVSERFHKFLGRLEETLYYGDGNVNVRLIFVLFRENEDRDVLEITSALEKFKIRNPKAWIKHVVLHGEFNRAVGLDEGTKLCKDEDLMLFLDVDLSITPEFLNRVRANTIRSVRVVFPIMFSQFDPTVISEFTKTAWVSEPTKGNIGSDKGFWIYYAFGVAAMYKSDYQKVGGFRLDIHGWGGEDVDLYKKMIGDDSLDVMSTVDPDLIHIYHSRSCDKKLVPDQYRMCIGALSETIGSKIQLGTLYLKNKEK